MTNEEKQLLLKDLCARLPYKLFVKGNFAQKDNPSAIYTIGGYYPVTDTEIYLNEAECLVKVESIKPYLRPMSSMTEEERCGYEGTFQYYGTVWSIESLDWLNTHHFDYRSLINKGLALEAPEGMY